MDAEGGDGAASTTPFIGEYTHTLDDKARVILPRPFRDQLKKGLVMTAWLDNCLTVLPQDGWERVLANVRQLQYTDRKQRQFARMMMSSAQSGGLDKQGRVTIPARLRDYADISRDVTVVGADDHLELWDVARWEEYREQGMAEFANTNQSFDLGGIL